MKILYVLLLSFAFTASAPFEKGIDFFDGNYTEALALSKKTGKPIFIDFYASWCGPCKQLKKTFKDKDVGAYYNLNFISLSVNGEKGEGPELMRVYGVSSYPTLLIVNHKGKPLARTTGYLKPHILVNFGRRVVPN